MGVAAARSADVLVRSNSDFHVAFGIPPRRRVGGSAAGGDARGPTLWIRAWPGVEWRLSYRAMNWTETIQRWRQLSSEARERIRWERIPRQVALSMAFEREPVELSWLQTLHPPGAAPPRRAGAISLSGFVSPQSQSPGYAPSSCLARKRNHLQQNRNLFLHRP